MNPALFLTPLIPAAICWLLAKICITLMFRPAAAYKLLGFRLQGFLPGHRSEIAEKIADAVQDQLIDGGFLEHQLGRKEVLQNAMPVIEQHIDNFLNTRLKEAIPVISMFVGEKIIAQLKDLFIKELEELFPSVMSQFIGDLSHTGKIKQQIVVKLSSIPVGAVQAKFFRYYGERLRRMELGFAFSGLIAGFLQLTVFILMS